MRILVLSTVLLGILLSAGCAASSAPPLTLTAPPPASVIPATPVIGLTPAAPVVGGTPTAAVMGVTPSSAAATSPAPAATSNATPRAGITLAPRKPSGTPPSVGELNLTFERSGGFTGRIETFRLKPDGSVDDGKVVLHAPGGPSDAASLATQIAATGIYAVAPGQYMAANTCCDRFEYDLTLTQNGQSYHFITIDSADSEPPALAQTVRLISQYINAAH